MDGRLQSYAAARRRRACSATNQPDRLNTNGFLIWLWPCHLTVPRPYKGSISLKKHLITFLKITLPIAIIVWLLANVPQGDFEQLRDRPKNLPMLGAAFLCTLTAVCLTFARWYLLVRALNLKFRMRDAFRLGFLGYLFNFVSAGSVGGDLFKAYFLAREQPGRRPEAVATVLVDRIIGLYALLLVTSSVILVRGVPNATVQVATICRVTLISTAVGGVGILLLMIPGFTTGALSEMLANLPKVGPTLERLIVAVRIYRTRWGILLVAILMSIGTHLLFALSLFGVANALFEYPPSFAEHLVIVPLGMLAGAIPFMPAGFGAFEFAIDQLYKLVPAAANMDVSGVLVALTFRLMTILVAAIGVAVYWTSRREVRDVLEEVEHQQTSPDKR